MNSLDFKKHWWSSAWFPPILRPDYTWQRPIRGPVATTTPPTPPVTGRFMRLFWGHVHRALFRFSGLYYRILGVRRDPVIVPLPFGLILKWSERVRPEEAIAMQMARSAGMPTPKMLCYGEHPKALFKYSILMTRLPGFEMCQGDGEFDPENEQPWFDELKLCVNAMRQWKSPYGNSVCSALGTSISSQRVPRHAMGPFKSEKEMNDYLLSAASRDGFDSSEKYDEVLTRARSIYDTPHPICFTHGDFKSHNILFDEEYHLSGFIDWESAGWYPAHWEFVTARRFFRDSWWAQGIVLMSDNSHEEELETDRFLNKLTVNSYIGM
ncbi:MAG: hypothetical protein MMC23_003078 [Stictis urceolatum]|nr:hypothetical protein [Stictis urceolata]